MTDNTHSFVDVLGRVSTLEIPKSHTCEQAAAKLTALSGIPHKVLTPKDKVLWPTSPSPTK